MTTPDTIVLIHGFWVTPRSWEHWKARYESKGFTVRTPAYPGFEVEVEVEALRADPTPIADLTIEAIVSHLEDFLDTLDTKPILMGHSAGGAFMQVVLDHGYGCAAVGLAQLAALRRLLLVSSPHVADLLRSSIRIFHLHDACRDAILRRIGSAALKLLCGLVVDHDPFCPSGLSVAL